MKVGSARGAAARSDLHKELGEHAAPGPEMYFSRYSMKMHARP